jgi:hypothetical protein
LLGRLVEPIQQFTFTTNGNSTVYLGDTSGGAQPNQANPTGFLSYAYVAGDNNLQVHVNGIKQYASERGYFDVFGTSTGSPVEGFGLFKGTRTGLGSVSAYSFNINVNGAGNVAINLPASTDNEVMGSLVAAINAIADANYFESGSPNVQYAFGCQLLGGVMRFTSGIPGTGSSVVVSDVTLFAAMAGDAGSTGLFAIASPLSGGFDGESPTPDPNYLPVTRGYDEVGRPGKETQSFVFNTVPSSGDIIEVRIDHNMFGERLA